MLLNMLRSKVGTCSFGVGIEAGMYPVSEADTKFMDVSICAIYDGNNYYIGFSPSFECPQESIDRALKGEELGLMHDLFVDGKGRKGVIWTVSKERICREEFEELAVMMSLIQVVNK